MHTLLSLVLVLAMTLLPAVADERIGAFVISDASQSAIMLDGDMRGEAERLVASPAGIPNETDAATPRRDNVGQGLQLALIREQGGVRCHHIVNDVDDFLWVGNCVPVSK